MLREDKTTEMALSVIERNEAIPNYTERICQPGIASLPAMTPFFVLGQLVSPQGLS